MATEMNTELDELDTDVGGEQEPLLDEDFEVAVAATDDEESEAPAEDSDSSEAEEAGEAAPPAADDAVAETDEVDAELAAMPDKIKKRFQREKRLRDTIISEREQIKSVAVHAAQLAQQREGEVLSLKKQNAQLQRQFAETLDYAYERDISLKNNELRKAREEGNYDAETKLQSELDTLRFQHNQVKQAKTTLPDPDKVVAPPAQPQAQAAPQQGQPAPQQRPPPAPLAVKWLDNNKSWFQHPKFRGHKAFVLAEDAALVAEGYDPKSKEYYEELDRRIDSNFPTLRKKGKQTSASVAGVGKAPASNVSSRTITLTKADLANMRAFGLDPTNKEHLREYARNKRAA